VALLVPKVRGRVFGRAGRGRSLPWSVRESC